MRHYDDPFSEDIMRSMLFQSEDEDFYYEDDEYFDEEEDYLDEDDFYYEEDDEIFLDEDLYNEGDLDEFGY